MIEHVRVSEKARNQLITLKRKTGIQQWNVLCRWAFCLSLAEKSVPPDEDIVADSSVEMSWRTFTSGQEAIYWALLVQRIRSDGLAEDGNTLARYFRLHLHRGISYLNGAVGSKGIEPLLVLAQAGGS
ncbi:DNA sulfur modification protein DndE [Burkholderia pseudomallei]|uniref:DNA sulfur modification protein DndE n=1 Tax=Burkholderia pseudomallei TaxID=28450 RepID=UPI0018C6079E|nr:DNA sulfur modification protein DndE [Burkholderia pseudomallei]MBG1252216.1 DNA sulfur modification protein DndE [Burkholderia pseudomallei]